MVDKGTGMERLRRDVEAQVRTLEPSPLPDLGLPARRRRRATFVRGAVRTALAVGWVVALLGYLRSPQDPADIAPASVQRIALEGTEARPVALRGGRPPSARIETGRDYAHTFSLLVEPEWLEPDVARLRLELQLDTEVVWWWEDSARELRRNWTMNANEGLTFTTPPNLLVPGRYRLVLLRVDGEEEHTVAAANVELVSEGARP